MKRKYDEINNESSIIDIDDKCPICMEKLGNTNLTITKCGHKFCHTCLDSYSCNNNKCPICRADIETNIKIKTLCNCDIRESVSRSMYNANPHLNNLCKRIIKKLLYSISDHELKDETFQDDKDINDIRELLVEKLEEDKDFEDNVVEFLFKEIGYFTLITSKNACFHLKSIFESLT